MPNIGHSFVWLVDALLDVINVNGLSPDCIPPLYRHWERTMTHFDPTLTWGVQFMAIGLGGSGALPSSLHDDEHISKVLQSYSAAEMVARRDAAALERLTGVATDTRHLDELSARINMRSRAQIMLNQHGASEVRSRLLSNTAGPAMEPVRPERPRLDLGVVAPTPFAASVGNRTGGTTIVSMPTMDLDVDDVSDRDLGNSSDNATASRVPPNSESRAIIAAPMELVVNPTTDLGGSVQNNNRGYGGTDEERAARKTKRDEQKNKRKREKRAQLKN